MFIFIFPDGQVNKNEIFYKDLYKKADSIFNGESDEHTDSIALSLYSEIISHVSPTSANADFLYNCNERSGILKQGLGYNSKEILNNFYTALNYYRQYHLPDSILFRLLLSIGNTHYNDGLFDSALFYFTEAENIIERYPHAGLAGDLYNSLGALYSESGDYKQSSIYFNKALEITRKERPDLNEAIFAMSLNIASALKLSGYRDTAIYLYKKLLASGPLAPVLNNLAGIYLLKKIPDSALYYLNQVPSPEGNFAISYHNSIAEAWLQKNDLSKAYEFLTKASTIYHENFDGTRNTAFSKTNKLLGDLYVKKQQLKEALASYQESIIQADNKFNDKNVNVNPGNFTGDFASYGLFESLLAKANCFTLLFEKEKADQIFNAAATTFDTAFALADYIKKSIDNDEARLFIADKVFRGYQQAIEFILSNQARNNEVAAVIKALQWISKARATSLAISLRENTIKRFAGLPDSLLQREKNSKVGLSRLKLYLQQATDSSEIASFISEIYSKELELHELQNEYRKFPAYYSQKFAADSFDIKTLQQNIPDSRTAIIAYFMGEKTFMSFVIRRSGIYYASQHQDTLLNKQIKEYISRLSNLDNPPNNKLSEISTWLSSKLIQPLMSQLDGIHSLIIIPDQQLINLPFEALKLQEGEYLTEKFAITYQYALPFLHVANKKRDLNKVLAFAPFASEIDKTKNKFSQLPSSSDEISGFDKKDQLLNADATKISFELKAPFASVLHLATHAVADYSNPSASYIAFYPVNNSDSSYKIYAHELYNLQLPYTRLVFLSACETGTGKISQSEGALSLSRAFAYAGCENIVTSLWRAEDNTTAYISKKFYEYVRKGYTYADALQQAKKDLLSDATMSQFHAPQYWSHLIFIGDMQQKNTETSTWIFIAGAVLLLLLIAYFFMKKRKSLNLFG